jgi:hypothetical protein
MTSPLNPNDSLVITTDYDVRSPRHLGRGRALKSSGAESAVSWSAGNVLVDDVILFALATQPLLLDLSFDQNDRPIVAYKTGTGNFIYYYSPLGAGGYVSEPVGSGEGIIIHNDFHLRGNNIVCAYLIAGAVKFRLHADRWATEYSLNTHRLKSITHFGIGVKQNSLNVLGTTLDSI